MPHGRSGPAMARLRYRCSGLLAGCSSAEVRWSAPLPSAFSRLRLALEPCAASRSHRRTPCQAAPVVFVGTVTATMTMVRPRSTSRRSGRARTSPIRSTSTGHPGPRGTGGAVGRSGRATSSSRSSTATATCATPTARRHRSTQSAFDALRPANAHAPQGPAHLRHPRRRADRRDLPGDPGLRQHRRVLPVPHPTRTGADRLAGCGRRARRAWHNRRQCPPGCVPSSTSRCCAGSFHARRIVERGRPPLLLLAGGRTHRLRPGRGPGGHAARAAITFADFGQSFYWAVTTVMGSGDSSYVTSPPAATSSAGCSSSSASPSSPRSPAPSSASSSTSCSRRARAWVPRATATTSSSAAGTSTARELIAELARRRVPDQDRADPRRREEPGRRAASTSSRGDVTSADDLRRAGIEEAMAAVVCPADASNEADMRSILTVMAIESIAPAGADRRRGQQPRATSSTSSAPTPTRSWSPRGSPPGCWPARRSIPGLAELVTDIVSGGDGSELYRVALPDSVRRAVGRRALRPAARRSPRHAARRQPRRASARQPGRTSGSSRATMPWSCRVARNPCASPPPARPPDGLTRREHRHQERDPPDEPARRGRARHPGHDRGPRSMGRAVPQLLGLLGAAGGFAVALLLAATLQDALANVEQPMRAFVAVAGLVTLTLLGEAIGSALGSRVRMAMRERMLGAVDLAGGMLVGFGQGVLAVWIVGGLVLAGALPEPRAPGERVAHPGRGQPGAAAARGRRAADRRTARTHRVSRPVHRPRAVASFAARSPLERRRSYPGALGRGEHGAGRRDRLWARAAGDRVLHRRARRGDQRPRRVWRRHHGRGAGRRHPPRDAHPLRPAPGRCPPARPLRQRPAASSWPGSAPERAARGRRRSAFPAEGI